MEIHNTISKLCINANMSQVQFAELFDVSRQSVQKWESGVSVPELEKLIKIAKYFDISLDALVQGSANRIPQELRYYNVLKPKYENLPDWESYSSDLLTEYQKSIEEGLDIEPSTLEEIRNLRENVPPVPPVDESILEQKIEGAWMGRICGCPDGCRGRRFAESLLCRYSQAI